jgi:hypothetical protein
MKIRYFADSDTLYIGMNDRLVAETREINENTLLDLDAEGNLVALCPNKSRWAKNASCLAGDNDAAPCYSTACACFHLPNITLAHHHGPSLINHLWRPLVKHLLAAIFVVCIVLSGAPTAAGAAAPVRNVLSNGSFEQGFGEISGCGEVAVRWGCFTNGGAANYGFYADQWSPVVADGKYSQLIEINTYGLDGGDNDRYAGIYQTTRVVPGEKYELQLRGMIRTSNLQGDPWRYRVQVGHLPGPRTDWRDVDNWTDVGWNTYYSRTEPGSFSEYHTFLVPTTEAVTIFVRVWKKWGIGNEELDVNLDAMVLAGPPPKK